MNRRQDFGDLLRGYRRASDLTQEDLAERAGISVRGLSDLERGVSRAPHRDTILLLADALKLDGVERDRFLATARRLVAGTSSHSREAPSTDHAGFPDEPTPFIGREAEIAALCELLLQPQVRLVTLTGAGGTGKTRLSLRVARALLDDFPDGMYFVPLASVGDAALIPSAIGSALGMKEDSDRPLLDVLVEGIQEKQVLLVLDNFEHLVSGAAMLAYLLDACSMVKVLVTSRTVLHLTREYGWEVPPLSLPDSMEPLSVQDLSRAESVVLFVDRARAASAGFVLNEENVPAVAEICRRLDGLPLAIELAAARVRLFPPQALLTRLSHKLKLLTAGPRDAPHRQQTLRNTIDWSYALLDMHEQHLFARLAVFTGGCTLEAAEAVCGKDLGVDVLDGMASLVEQSLMGQEEKPEGTPRYQMLETIREYALERFEEREEGQELRRHHVAYFVTFAEAIETEIGGSHQSATLEQVETDHDNIRAALAWSLEGTGTEIAEGLRLAAAIQRFWVIRGYLAEGRSWLEQLLMASDRQVNAGPARAKALYAASSLAFRQGDLDRADELGTESLVCFRHLGEQASMAAALNILALVAEQRADFDLAATRLEESLHLRRELGDKRGIAIALANLANIAHERCDYSRAMELTEKSLALRREINDAWGIASALGNLANAAQMQGDYPRALVLGEESLARFRDLKDQIGIALCLVNLACVDRDRGESARATSLAEQSLGISRGIGYKDGIALALVTLGDVACDGGEYGKATAYFEDALAAFREMADNHGIPNSLMRLAYVNAAQGDDRRALDLYQESLRGFQAVGDRLGAATSLEGIAAILANESQPELAARILGAAASMREAIGAPIPLVDRPRVERTLKVIEAALGAQGLAEEKEAGKAMAPYNCA